MVHRTQAVTEDTGTAFGQIAVATAHDPSTFPGDCR